MDSNSMLLLGMVKLEKPSGESLFIEVKGFDVFGFFLPFLRLLTAGMWGKAALFVPTCWAYPIWSWYLGVNFKRMHFEKLLADGWAISKNEKKELRAA